MPRYQGRIGPKIHGPYIEAKLTQAESQYFFSLETHYPMILGKNTSKKTPPESPLTIGKIQPKIITNLYVFFFRNATKTTQGRFFSISNRSVGPRLAAGGTTLVTDGAGSATSAISSFGEGTAAEVKQITLR